jgi:type IV fimbrial biogenesis protein FimT
MKFGYKGFTLVELMIVLAIAGITMAAAVPTFQGMIVRNRIASHTNDFLLALNVARSEALRVGGTVSVVANAPVSGNNFGGGWCVAIGTPTDCTGALLQSFPAFTDNATLDSVEGTDSIPFNSLGGLGTAAIQNIDLCYPDYGDDAKRVIITPIGRSKSHSMDNPVTATRPTC